MFQPQHINTLTMQNILLLVLPLLLVAGCVLRNATTIDVRIPELPTFFGTASARNKIMAVCRLNRSCLFGFQIPPWIKEERMDSSGTVATLSFGHSLDKMSGNALFTASHIWGTRTALQPLRPIIGNSAVPNRTEVYGSQPRKSRD